jgi:hypothetical protein
VAGTSPARLGPAIRKRSFSYLWLSGGRRGRTIRPPSLEDYTPKRYSGREYVSMGAKIILVISFLLGLLWLFDAMAAN